MTLSSQEKTLLQQAIGAGRFNAPGGMPFGNGLAATLQNVAAMTDEQVRQVLRPFQADQIASLTNQITTATNNLTALQTNLATIQAVVIAPAS